MALQVPLQAVPSQIVTAALNNQTCQIEVVQLTTGLFLTLSVSNEVIISDVLCENLNRIVRDTYLGFSGDLFFVDTQGQDDPDFTGLADRYALMYIDPAEIAAGAV